MPAHWKSVAAAGVAAVALLLTGCSGPSAAEEAPNTAADDGAWPRTIEHVGGVTEIPAAPERIVSTSLTLAGTLLAIDAPIVATATTTPSAITDENGFFSQWADVAVERGVESLYPNLEFDEEAVIAADPDLIVVSSSGADSTADELEALSAIAPTIVLDYGANTWQQLAAVLGEATGHEDEAADVVASFDAHVAEVADAITVPDGTANAIVWNGTENPTAFAKPGSAHTELLESLGFVVEGAPDEFDTSEQPRNDFAFLSIENVTTALTGDTVFLVSGGDATADDLLATAVLATAPAIASGSVVSLGPTSFRIDYYSASQIVDIVESEFA
ncbi:Fe2+-enterobactin ABC transporter substrate-binding protein [Agromyces larvae]|uniref:Fe2+-enterobactin ABC transporter substrate-binding protein n=1 Tax=Agromyces larvae TaxID=2929802 RepID=A0ABY4BZE2_9MICO|nr:Fe2+-enterobactin ABC transporter substrate-binding protein [Agromyces larvae]UOE43231.1 Fe2+-enterobactin ABC transporter substrate-binding protein [Agromyces larvae]